MMQFVVFSLLCQLLANAAAMSAVSAAESKFFNKFSLNPIASQLHKQTEKFSYFDSASQEPTQKQLIIQDFELFYQAKDFELSATIIKEFKVELSVTNEQMNNYTEFVGRFASSAERLIFSNVTDRADPSFGPLRNETNNAMEAFFTFHQTLSESMKQDFVPREFVTTFIENAQATLSAIIHQDENAKKSILCKLEILRDNSLQDYVDSKETEIFNDLCQLDKGNIFFQHATKPLVTHLARLARIIEQIKGKDHQVHLVMLEHYYAKIIGSVRIIEGKSCKDPGDDGFLFLGDDKLLEHDPILETFQQKLGIQVSGSGVSQVASGLMVALGLMVVLLLSH